MVIIVRYPMWGNGKFIINCLGLSNHVVLQDKGLARQQIDGCLTPDQKLEELLGRLQLENKDKEWEDLGLGCIQLFNFNASKSWKHCHMSDEAKEADQKGFICFIIAHNDYHERNLKQLFGNVAIIELKPPDRWLYDKDQFLNYIKALYAQLNLNDFDEKKIIVYYNAYTEKLKEVKRWPNKYL